MAKKKRTKQRIHKVQKQPVVRGSKRVAKNLRSAVFIVFPLGILLTSTWFFISGPHVSLDILPNPELSGMEGQVAEKIRLLRLEVEKNPNSSITWAKLAMNLDVHELKSESVICYKQAAALNPKEFRWPYYCAIALHEMGSPEDLEWFERSLLIMPNHAPLHNLYGRALFNKEQLEESSQAYRRAIALDPKLPHSYHGLAQIELSRGDVEASRKYLLKALEIEPRYSEAHGLLAVVYRRLGETQKGEGELRYLQQLPELTRMPDPVYAGLAAEGVSSWWYRRRGLAYMAAGRYRSAVKEFRMRLFLKADAQSHNNLGLALQRLGNHDEAIEQLQAAIALDKSYAEAFNNLAAALYEKGQTEEAKSYIDKALKLNPVFAAAYLNLGIFHLRAGEMAAAIRVFRHGLAEAPDHIEISSRLAWVLATTRQEKLRDGNEAIGLAENICKMTSYLIPRNLDVLAAAYAEEGEFEKAVKTVHQALQLIRPSHRDLGEQFQRRLKLYQVRKPYRE